MAATLPRPYNFTQTISDEEILRAIELMTDYYNAKQLEANPAHVDVGPGVYLRQRIVGWLLRERRLKDPDLTEDPDVLRLALRAARNA